MKKSRTVQLDWTAVLAEQARHSDVIDVGRITAKYGVPARSAWRALTRLADRGLISRVKRGVYLNKLVQDFSALDFVNILNPHSYVSLESALSHWGVSTQSPVTLTCVTDGKPKQYRSTEFSIGFRKISKELFWGFIEKQTRYSKYRIAEPEKAILDWIYLSLQSGLTPHLDELVLKTIDRQRLLDYVAKYPTTVRNVLAHSITFEHYAA